MRVGFSFRRLERRDADAVFFPEYDEISGFAFLSVDDIGSCDRTHSAAGTSSRNCGTAGCALRPRTILFLYASHPSDPIARTVVSFVSLGEVSSWLFANHPMGNPPPPDGYTWGLETLCLVWALAIVIL